MILCYFARQHALGSSGLQRLPLLSGLLALGQPEDASDCRGKSVWKPCTILLSSLWVIPAFLPFPSCIPGEWGKAAYKLHKHQPVLLAAGAGSQAQHAHRHTCVAGYGMGPAEMGHEEEGKDPESSEWGLGFASQKWLAKQKCNGKLKPSFCLGHRL